jgi:hypothetical protein
MYYQQNGFFPWATKIVGLPILASSTFITLVETIAKLITNHTPEDLLIAPMAFCVVLLFPVWLGLLLVKMFPALRVVSTGIKYSSMGVLKGIIKWDEIEEVLLFENDYAAIAFQRPGLFLINGTYFNKLYGILIRHESTVLFLSPNIANHEEIMNTIFENSKVKSYKNVIRRK